MEAEGRARAERTSNMDTMLVTLDVSRLSGWLNASADCQVERKGKHMRRGDMRAQAGTCAGMVGGASSREARLWRLRAGHARSAPETSAPCL